MWIFQSKLSQLFVSATGFEFLKYAKNNIHRTHIHDVQFPHLAKHFLRDTKSINMISNFCSKGLKLSQLLINSFVDKVRIEKSLFHSVMGVSWGICLY